MRIIGGKYKGKTVLSKKWVDTVFERGYELRCIKDDIYGKGGMLGQMLALYKSAGVSVAWHGYRDFDADELFDRIRDLL